MRHLVQRYVAALLVIMAAAAAVTALACRNHETQLTAPTPRQIRIGILLPKTGSMAEYGQNGLDGLELARAELEATHNVRVVLHVEDARETAAESVAALRRLIDIHRVQLVIGGVTSSGVLAAAPIAQARGVLFFSPAASAPGIPEIGELVFRNWQSDTLLAAAFAEWAQDDLKVGSVAVLAVGNDYGNTNATVFSAEFSKLGGTVKARSTFPEGAADYKQHVGRIASAGAGAAYVVAYPDEFRGFFREVTKQRVKPQYVLVSDTFFSPELGKELATAAEGAYCAVAAKPDATYAPRNDFVERYRRKFRREPGLVSDTAYDALNLVVAGILRGDGTPQGVSKYLLSLRDYPGAAGETTFTATGDVVGGTGVYQLRSGKFEHVKTLTTGR